MTPRASHPRRKARAGEHQQWEGTPTRLSLAVARLSPCSLPRHWSCHPWEMPSQGDASPQPRVGENDQSPPLPEAAGEHGHPLHEALSVRRGEDGFAYVTQLSLTENKRRSFVFVGKLALTAPCPFSRSNCDSSTCL